VKARRDTRNRCRRRSSTTICGVLRMVSIVSSYGRFT
jgi:hypothetical protein